MQRSGDARGDCLVVCPPTKVLSLVFILRYVRNTGTAKQPPHTLAVSKKIDHINFASSENKEEKKAVQVSCRVTQQLHGS